MKPERIQELRGLCSRATPPPWRAHHAHGLHVASHAVPLLDSVCVADLSPDDSVPGWNGTAADAAFIAAARTAVPELLDAVERLTLTNDDLEALALAHDDVFRMSTLDDDGGPKTQAVRGRAIALLAKLLAIMPKGHCR